MKIIELCTSKGWGGLELYVWQVSQWLNTHAHECHVVIASNSLIAERLKDSDISTSFIQPRFRLFPWLAAFHLARFIDQQQVNILHVHWTKDLILAALAKRLSRRPVKLVFSRHMALTRHKRDIYHRFIYGSIDKFLVISKRLYAEARRYLPVAEDRLELLYHGIADFPAVNPENCQQTFRQNNLSNAKFRILLPGRIEHYKGQHTLLEAIILLQQRGYDVDVVILGHIMDEAYFRKLEQQTKAAGLEKKVHYLGFVEKPTLIYGCFDVVVLTTYAETFGLVLVEAMKSGVAVIGTNAGGVPEIIEHDQTGMLYAPGNASELAECLQKLIEDAGLRQRLAVAGRAYAEATFSEQQHYSKLIQIFSELVNDKSENDL